MNDVSNTIAASAGSATGGVRRLLRIEGLAVLAASASVYFASGGSPWLFALVFFVPDLSFFAYALSPRIGAIAYNGDHTYILPVLLGGAGWVSGIDLLWHLALVLAAHAGLDRSLGYGLKYASAFNQTHLGTIGRRA